MSGAEAMNSASFLKKGGEEKKMVTLEDLTDRIVSRLYDVFGDSSGALSVSMIVQLSKRSSVRLC